MSNPRLTSLVLALALVAFGSSVVMAQTTASKSRYSKSPAPKSFLDEVGQFGRTVFGGLLPSDKRRSSPAPDYSRSSAPQRQGRRPATASRSGSNLGGTSTEPSPAHVPANTYVPVDTPLTASRSLDTQPARKPVARPNDDAEVAIEQHAAETELIQQTNVAEGSDATVEVPASDSEISAAATGGNVAQSTRELLGPLHTRLERFRRSATGAAPTEQRHASDPPLMAQQAPQPAVETQNGQPSIPSSANREMASPTPAVPEASSAGLRTLATPADRTSRPREAVLFTRKSPILSVETVGPRKIAVGKESTYQVIIQNSGDVAADEVAVSVSLPEWADVLGASASTGATHVMAGNSKGSFMWRVGRLDAHGREQLGLRIVPRQSRPFDLAVRWDYQPVSSQTLIEVQEPKLTLELEGPREVLYGKKEVYRLHLANVGNGEAENVNISLLPIGTGINRPVSQVLGNVPAGEKKTIEVELTARQIGNLTVNVEVRGDGGVHAEMSEKVFVRRAALQVEVFGPRMQYVGGKATYQVRVRNPGTAEAGNVNVVAQIPAGAQYLSGVDGATLSDDGRKLSWTLADLNPGAEQVFTFHCELGVAGISRLEIVSTANDDLTATAGATTQVEAMADLVLDVEDPSGPMPVGRESTYKLRIRNRGTKEASNVEIRAYFSRGIEPVAAEGGVHRISPGQIVFNPIATVAPDGDLTFTIRARAETAGNHVFRAEVYCKPLGTRLVSEETTHYYAELPGTNRFGKAEPPTDRYSEEENSAAHTADQHGRVMQGAPPQSLR